MPALRDKIQNALDESRILILGTQVLVGFQFRAVLEPGYDQLGHRAQVIGLGALGFLLAAVGLVIAPTSFHRIVEGGRDSGRLHHYIREVIGLALLPIALGLGANLYLAARRTVGVDASAIIGIGAGLVALLAWYGVEALALIGKESPHVSPDESEKVDLTHRIRQVLTETRVVLPGAQALLGFQFVTTMLSAFDKLPASSRIVHLVSLLCTALSTVLLMAPPAYHRIVEGGEDSERFQRIAGALLLASLPPLGLGIAGDVFVVTRKITSSPSLGIAFGALSLAFFLGLWFAYPLLQRALERRGGRLAFPRAGG